MAAAHDTLGRPVRDLRISVTDRCNFRCPYCMPKEAFGPEHTYLTPAKLMNPGEILTIARVFVGLGVQKVRLTGGEPLLRAELCDIIHELKSSLGVPDVSLTTNGWLLARQAENLRKAGLDRINVSLDALDEEVGGRMNGLGFKVSRVLEGIEAASRAGLPVKVNCVVQKGANDSQIIPLCSYFREKGHVVRFIEFMDVGTTNHWRDSEVVPAHKIVKRISALWPLEPLDPTFKGEVASRYRYGDGRGEIGIVSSVTEPFCSACHRARLSADGKLFTCLFAASGSDILGLVRSGASDSDLSAHIAGIWRSRSDRYSEERSSMLAAGKAREKVEMSYIGG